MAGTPCEVEEIKGGAPHGRGAKAIVQGCTL